MTVSLDQALVKQLIAYLARQPYAEVFNFIPALAQAAQAKAVPPAAVADAASKKAKPAPAVSADVEKAKAALKKQLEEASA